MTEDLEFEIKFYEELLRENPGFSDVWPPLAEAYTRKGQYQKADMWKYWTAMALMGALFVVTIIRQEISGMNLELAIGFLGPGIVGIIAIMIAGMKANKAATVTNGRTKGAA